MGKHRNPSQEKIFVDFMKCHQNIARGYVQGSRDVGESNWKELTEILNSSGPPTKDCYGWKKTWADWKAYVKKKIRYYKKENDKKYIVSNIEESLATVSGLHESTDSFVCEDDLSIYHYEFDKENDIDVTASTSKSTKRKESTTTDNEQFSLESGSSTSTPSPGPMRYRSRTQKRYRSRTPKRYRSRTPKRYRSRTLKLDLNALLKENKRLQTIVDHMEEQRTNKKLEKIVHLMEEQREEMKIQNQKLDRLCNILENHYKARRLNDQEIQKRLHEKNELKLKLIEIETFKQ